ncbi:MAG: hypothetical protein K8L97_18800 [Anaerolineae bacterium]|nr:hypothetical protein [Anaerolineae bacterium]
MLRTLRIFGELNTNLKPTVRQAVSMMVKVSKQVSALKKVGNILPHERDFIVIPFVTQLQNLSHAANQLMIVNR